MKKNVFLFFVVFVLIFVSSAIQKSIYAQKQNQSAVTEDCAKFNFRFFVTKNVTDSANLQSLEVFMEESAFSEQNLMQMFKYLSAQNTDAKILIIRVKTNWNQFSFRNDCLGGYGSSNRPYDPSIFDYHYATYHRSNASGVKREYFKYNPVLKVDNEKIVHIRENSK